MDYYLGIDIGTTSSKAIAFSVKGEVIASCSFDYEMNHPQPNRSEQNPDEIFEAVLKGIEKVVKEMSPELPVFISFSAAMHSVIAVDEKGNLLSQCIIWADNRADIIAEKLRSSEKGHKFYSASGVPVHSMSPLCKLLWFKENQPDIFNIAYKFIGIKEYVFYKLFGDFVVDTSIASATGLLNTKTLQWDEEILDFIGITSSLLSQVVTTKHLIYYKGQNPTLSILKNVPFVIGASDGALSNLGTGATGKNAMAITIGTSGAARMVVSAPETDSKMRTFCYHLKDNLYIAGGANNNGAVVLQWLKEALLETGESYEKLYEQAQAVEAGSEDLIFLPYILGERAPLWNSNAKGVFFGLHIAHTKAHLIRASMEGVIFSLYSIGKILAENKEITELHASGGFAKSTLWLQILADVFNIKVLVSEAVESSALGAVMLGAEAVGINTAFQNHASVTYNPIASNHQLYINCFNKFERLYELLKHEMTPASASELNINK
ncbi:gluconokinase [Segetibacter koreensis]|uniref:gluconokinase n=1 Tax=Segetibacter koreensis TaxID=398037 RepID=UPI000367C2F1|nr:gluconokinase [Segetibacter koreensis]